jgi:hypothetical protein
MKMSTSIAFICKWSHISNVGAVEIHVLGIYLLANVACSRIAICTYPGMRRYMAFLVDE